MDKVCLHSIISILSENHKGVKHCLYLYGLMHFNKKVYQTGVHLVSQAKKKTGFCQTGVVLCVELQRAQPTCRPRTTFFDKLFAVTFML